MALPLGDGSHQLPGVLVFRRVEDIQGLALFHDVSFIHDDNVLAQLLYDHQVVADEQDADFVDPVREICKIYMAQEHPLTEQFLRESVARFPNEAMARYDLALFLQDHGAPEEALAHYDSLLSIQPENSRLLFNKGYVYFVYLGDNEKALDYFNRSLASDPTYLDALYNKGHVLEQMGDYVQAKDIYTKVLQQKPNYQLAVDAMNRIANQSE